MGVQEELSHVFELEQMASHAHKQAEIEMLISNLTQVCEKAFGELSVFVRPI
jgi:hypothetical protein